MKIMLAATLEKIGYVVQGKLRCETKIGDGVVPLPVPFMKRKKGTSQISLLGRCGRKKTQFSSSTIASDPCACTLKKFIIQDCGQKLFETNFNERSKCYTERS